MVYVAGIGNLSQPDLLFRPTPPREKLPVDMVLQRKKSHSPPLTGGSGIARRLRQPAVLINPSSNLPHQPFPGVCHVKLAPGRAQGRKQTRARERGRWRSETSYLCQLPAIKSIASSNFALPAPGGWEPGGGTAGVAVGVGSNPSSSLLLPVLGKEKLKIFFPAGKLWVKQKESFQKCFLNKSSVVFFSQNVKTQWFCCQKEFAEEGNGF